MQTFFLQEETARFLTPDLFPTRKQIGQFLTGEVLTADLPHQLFKKKPDGFLQQVETAQILSTTTSAPPHNDFTLTPFDRFASSKTTSVPLHSIETGQVLTVDLPHFLCDSGAPGMFPGVL